MPYIITINDIGKPVFLRIQKEADEPPRWENEGCTLHGIKSDGQRLIIKLPDGNLWTVVPSVVRIFEPRPKNG